MTHAAPPSATIDPCAVIERLFDAEAKLSEEIAGAIRALGKSAVPRLLEILTDESLQEDDAKGAGYAPIHAANLLIDLRAEEALEPLLELYSTLEFDLILRDRIAVRFPEYGAAALEPILARLGADPEYDDIESYCWLLSELGVRDERIAKLLRIVLEEEPEIASTMVATYGDPAFVPALLDTLWALKHDGKLDTARVAVEIEAALKQLGFEIPPDVAEHIVACQAYFAQPKPVARVQQVTPKTGRNDPCPCGSGKKYKRCCLN
jgi:HEAT repeat protein